MPYNPTSKSVKAASLLLFTLGAAAPAIHAEKAVDTGVGASGVIKETVSPKSAAYYHFTLGHLYEELAGAYGNRAEYINKAIDNFQLAMKEDPSASFLVQDIAELYRMSGRIREAVEEAQSAIKANPDDLNARRVLARIYTQQIGDAQANHIDENMVHKAIEQYGIVTEKDPKDVDSLVILGRLDKVVGDSVGAENAFKKVLVAEPDNEDGITGLAGVYADRGNMKQATTLLEDLNKKNPSVRSLVALASAYEQMKQFGQAADAYRRALDMDSTRNDLRPALAQAQALAGRYDDAVATFQALADANPQDAEPLLGIAQIYRQEHKFEQAEQALNKAKDLDPDNLEIRYNQVLLYQDQGRIPDAITVLKGMVDSSAHRNYTASDRATRADMLDRLGSLYRANQQYDLAIDAFRQLSSLNGDLAPRAEAQIIDTYRVSHDLNKAAQESDTALKKFPSDRMLVQVHAAVLADQGKTTEAVAEMRKLLDGKAKDDLDVYERMAEFYNQGHDYADMAKSLDSAEKLASDKDDQVNIRFLRGSMFEREKKFEQAEQEFRKVLDADPNNASALNYLGYMLADQGIRLPEALDMVKHAVELEPNNYAYLDSLGWTYYKQGKLPEAEEQLRHSLQLQGTDPTIHDHLGDVLAKEGKLKDAVNEWQTSMKDWNTGSAADADAEEMAKVQKKLDNARVKLAKMQTPARP